MGKGNWDWVNALIPSSKKKSEPENIVHTSLFEPKIQKPTLLRAFTNGQWVKTTKGKTGKIVSPSGDDAYMVRIGLKEFEFKGNSLKPISKVKVNIGGEEGYDAFIKIERVDELIDILHDSKVYFRIF